MKKIIGIVDATYQKDSQPRVGTRVFVASEVPAGSGSGYSIETLYISGVHFESFTLGDILTPIFESSFNGQAFCTGIVYTDGSIVQRERR